MIDSQRYWCTLSASRSRTVRYEWESEQRTFLRCSDDVHGWQRSRRRLRRPGKFPRVFAEVRLWQPWPVDSWWQTRRCIGRIRRRSSPVPQAGLCHCGSSELADRQWSCEKGPVVAAGCSRRPLPETQPTKPQSTVSATKQTVSWV